MMMTGADVTKNRLLNLERTVDALNGRLRDMQWALRQPRRGSLGKRLWNNWIGPRQEHAFMSEVCNRRIRPNTKSVNNAIAITRR